VRTASSRPSDAAILLGLAAGLRTFSAPAALALRKRPLGAAGRLLLLAAAVEMIADKLPSMPSRLARRGLTGRLLSSTASGHLVAGRAGARSSAGAALASAVCGNRARGTFAGFLSAVAEDAIAIALATLGAARSRR
jgi:uncharacterized membrane protein